jgi:hypothetical protein
VRFPQSLFHGKRQDRTKARQGKTRTKRRKGKTRQDKAAQKKTHTGQDEDKDKAGKTTHKTTRDKTVCLLGPCGSCSPPSMTSSVLVTFALTLALSTSDIDRSTDMEEQKNDPMWIVYIAISSLAFAACDVFCDIYIDSSAEEVRPKAIDKDSDIELGVISKDIQPRCSRSLWNRSIRWGQGLGFGGLGW